jgi:hypothetical protein
MPPKPKSSGKAPKSSKKTKSGKAAASTPATGYPDAGSGSLLDYARSTTSFDPRLADTIVGTMSKTQAIQVLQWIRGKWIVTETIGMLSGIKVGPPGMPKEPGRYEGERKLVQVRRAGSGSS